MKHQVIICAWIITKLKDICLLLIDGIKERLEDIFKTEPPWPTVVGATFARTAGIVLIVVIVVLIIFIVISYCLFCREGRHAGCLNSSNKKARKTITIHGLQMSLHLLVTTVGRHADNTILHLSAFLVLLFALCFNPVLYGQQNKELQTKLFNGQRLGAFTHHMANSNDVAAI